MKNKITNMLWTGGWDSTFRLLDLILIKESKVRPYYVIDSDRLSTGTEIRTMKNIKQILFNKHPHTKSLLLPTEFKEVCDIKPNTLITQCFKEVYHKNYPIGSQYEWLARFTDEYEISDIELSVHKDDKAHKALEPFVCQSFDENGLYYRVKENFFNSSEHTLFKYFRFPIFYLSKLDMERIALEKGFYDIMVHTWFCHKPRSNNSPCGVCKPCIYTIEEGLGKRIPLKGRIMYRLKTKKPIKRLPYLYSCMRYIKGKLLIGSMC
jgi:hypothetical protein